MCMALNTITCRLAGEPFIIFKLPKQVRYIISDSNGTLNRKKLKRTAEFKIIIFIAISVSPLPTLTQLS